MHVKIDWLSYTLRIPEQGERETDADYFNRMSSYAPSYVAAVPEWGTAARPGQVTGANIGDHTFLWIHRNGWLTIEHTGQGCSMLAGAGLLNSVCHEYAECATRVDIAVDIHDPQHSLNPAAIVASAEKPRTSAYGAQTSATGQTVYLGSKKSPRYVRVYRYSAPHDRHEWLRIEYVFRKDHAKAVLNDYIQDYSMSRLAVACGNHYQWRHPRYLREIEDIYHDYTIDAPAHDRKSNKTVFWLKSTVAKAIVKQAQSGAIDFEDYIEYLYYLRGQAT